MRCVFVCVFVCFCNAFFCLIIRNTPLFIIPCVFCPFLFDFFHFFVCVSQNSLFAFILCGLCFANCRDSDSYHFLYVFCGLSSYIFSARLAQNCVYFVTLFARLFYNYFAIVWCVLPSIFTSIFHLFFPCVLSD